MRINIVRKITYNWHIKLISLALAFILWVYVDSLKQKERFFSVSLEMKNVPEGYLVSNDLPPSVKVVLRGKESRLALVDEEKLRAYVDLDGSVKEEARRTVSVDRHLIPQGVSIKEVEPRIIDVKIEKVEEKRVSVIPVIVNDPPDGYYFEDVQIEPEQLVVRGPESLLKNLNSVYTRDIDIRNITETTLREVAVDIKDSKIMVEGPESVSVRIIVKEQYVLKRITKREVLPRNLAKEFSAQLENRPISLLLRIPRILERVFSQEQCTLFIDLEQIRSPGVYQLPLVFETDVSDVSLMNMDPERIEVKVQMMTKKQAESG
jgi:YbbR domain-containing protein